MAKKQDVKRYKCMNFGACTKADNGEIIEIDALETLSGKPVCPFCKQDTLEELKDKGGDKWKKIAMIGGAVVAVAALGVVALLVFGGKKKAPVQPVEEHSVKINTITASDGWNVKPADLTILNNGDTIWVTAEEGLDSVAVEKGAKLTITPKDTTASVSPSEITLTGLATVTVISAESKETATYVLALKKPEKPVDLLNTSKIEEDIRLGKGELKSEEGQKESEGKDKKITERTSTPVSTNPNYGTVNLGYGVYTGDLKNGKPHGHGTIKYKKAHKIVSSQDYVASPGDEFEGNFRNGVPSGGLGYWKHDGDVTGIKL